MSIIITLMITFYSIVLVKSLIMKQQSNNSLNKVFIDLAHDENAYYPYEEGFKFGVTLDLGGATPIEIDTSKINLRFMKISASFESNGGVRMNTTLVNSVKCPPESGMYKPFIARNSNVTNIYCPDDPNFMLRGNYLTKNYTFFRVFIHKCQANCSSDREIERYLENLSVNFIHTSSYVDFEDYKTPVKQISFLNKRYALSPKMSKIVNFKLKRNIAYFQDSLVHSDYFSCFFR